MNHGLMMESWMAWHRVGWWVVVLTNVLKFSLFLFPNLSDYFVSGDAGSGVESLVPLPLQVCIVCHGIGVLNALLFSRLASVGQYSST